MDLHSAKWLLAGESSRRLDLGVGYQFGIKKILSEMAWHLVGFLRALLLDNHGNSCKRGPSTLAIKSVQVDGEVEVEVELEFEVEVEEEVEEVGSSGDCGAGCPGQLQVSWRVVASGPPLATGPQAGVCRRAGRPPSATQ